MIILVADDDLEIREMLGAVLSRWGYQVTAVENGEEALSHLLAPDAPQLAVLDWTMPGLEGVEVCRRIRATDTESPPYLILLSGRSKKNDTVRGLQAGADDYVTKPFDFSELQARIEVGRRMVELRNALAQRVAELQAALAHIKTLQGILPICMHCHRIRREQDVWERIEHYISAHSEAKFSHGICPECLGRLYADLNIPNE